MISREFSVPFYFLANNQNIKNKKEDGKKNIGLKFQMKEGNVFENQVLAQFIHHFYNVVFNRNEHEHLYCSSTGGFTYGI